MIEVRVCIDANQHGCRVITAIPSEASDDDKISAHQFQDKVVSALGSILGPGARVRFALILGGREEIEAASELIA